MPLRRSPPPTSHATVTGPIRSTPTICAPEPCDSDTSDKSSCGNVNVRQKRRREDEDLKDLKSPISSLSEKVDQNFLEIRRSNEELQKGLKFISDKYDSILEQLQTLQGERAQDKKLLLNLDEKIEVIERKNRAASIELRNVPMYLQENNRTETKDDVCKIIKTLSKVVDVEIQDSDIRDMYRIPTHKEGAKPIIIELSSVVKKEKLLVAVKNFNKKQGSGGKLNTGHLNYPGPIKPVFISEALTPNTQKLFYAARQFTRENNYSDCWTSRGVIYLRKAEGVPQSRIDSELSLKALGRE